MRSSIKAIRELIAIMAICAFLSVTGLDRPSIPIGGDFKRRDP
jgi:hypothetical protein